MTPAKPESDLDLFARIKDGKIIEFPVYRLHIKNRAHPLDWYTPVKEQGKEETLPPFSYQQRIVELVGVEVIATYTTKEYSLAELLNQLNRGMDPVLGREVQAPKIEELDPALVAQVYKLTSKYATSKLNAFAQERGYDDIYTLCDYRDSMFDKFRIEGLRGYQLRDQVWIALTSYFDQVMAGVVPVPTSVEEIDAQFPAMTW